MLDNGSLIDRSAVARYLQDDRTAGAMDQAAGSLANQFSAHRWLVDSPAKRLAFWNLYGDIIEGHFRNRIVHDVGGGVHSPHVWRRCADIT